MKTISATIFLGIAALSLWSCGSDIKETPKGYKFQVVTHGNGETVKPGEVVILDMAIVDENDSAWYDNRLGDYPDMVRIAEPSKMEVERGISEVFRMLSKGDSILLPVTAKDLFVFMWKMNIPHGVNPESSFIYRVKCREVFTEDEARKFAHERDSIHEEKEKIRVAAEEEQKKIAEAELAEYNRIQLGKDTVIIDNYLKSKNVKARKLPNGMRYIMKVNGEGASPANGDAVNMRYTGQLLDGTEFDSGEYSFTVGNGDVIKGWDLIAMNMKKGTSLTLFVPSTLAYNRGGREPRIGPDAILVFEMELLGINKR